MLLAPTKHTLPLTENFFYVFVNSPLSALRSSHAPTYYYVSLSLQTNSGTHYTAADTVTASLDSLIGRQLMLPNQNVCTITGTRFGSYRCTKTGDKALRWPTGTMFEFFPTAVYQIITPAPSVTLVYSS